MSGIAIVGAACRLPGASSPDELWAMVREGRTGLVRRSLAELEADGVPRAVARGARYVPVVGLLEDVDGFDAAFFGIGDRDADVMDPQHRHFYEACWEAFERAGHLPERFDGVIGVFGGCGAGTYLQRNLLTNADLADRLGWFLLRHTANDKDFLTTGVSYRLGLTGPSVGVQTACSTSLVAVHLAAQSLLAGECDLALAGGVTIEVPHGVGYVAAEGEIASPSGVLRAFDAASDGAIFTPGVGVVVLRRLDDAVADGDHVHAVIAGSAVGNDGSAKVSYLAPSVDGHAAVVAEALGVAGLDAGDLGLVEAHGTGTAIGDPIEVAALSEAVGPAVPRGAIRLASVKANVGHTDTAAGVVSLLSAAAAVEHGELPPLANHTAPNSLLDLPSTPFHLAAESSPWPSPRCAGVSSLGVGGTNAHVVLHEAPPARLRPPAPRWALLPVSARSAASAGAAATRLADALDASLDLDDVAFTLQAGRRTAPHRLAVVAADHADAAARLRAARPADAGTSAPKVAFLFPGGGAQHAGMAAGLHAEDPVFAAALDDTLAAVVAVGGPDLRPAMLAGKPLDSATSSLPAVAAVELALVDWLASWGVRPDAVLGHSLGQYVAAHVAGVLDRDDALRLVVRRAELMEEVAAGGMLAVDLHEADLPAWATAELSVAAVNGPSAVVLSGPTAALDAVAARLEADGVGVHRLHLDVAAHSHLLDPVLDRFAAAVAAVELRPPALSLASDATGRWAGDEVADADHWVRHLRGTIRFGDALASLLADGDWITVEVGPGHALTGLASLQERRPMASVAVLPRPVDDHHGDEGRRALEAVGAAWVAGAAIDWPSTRAGRSRRRVPLPPTPWEHRRHWVEPGTGTDTGRAAPRAARNSLERLADPDRWWWSPTWQPAPLRTATATTSQPPVIVREGSPVPPGVDGAEDVVLVLDAALDVDVALAQLDLLAELARVIAGAARPPGRLLVLTQGAAAVPGACPHPAGALVAGAAPVVAKELGGPAVRVVDVDADADVADILTSELAATWLRDPHPVAWRAGRRLERRIEPIPAPSDGDAFAVVPGATYVVVGGLGALGRLVVDHLLEAGAARIVVLARAVRPHPWDPRVEVVEVDAGDPVALRRAVEGVEGVDAVLHLAGVLDDAPLLDRDADAIAAVVRPKAAAAEALVGAAPRLVLFSSISGLVGPPGQAAYAGASAVLDALAAAHTGVVAIDWAAWHGLGMAARGRPEVVAERRLRVDDWELDQHRLRTPGGDVPVLPGSVTLATLAATAGGAVEDVALLAPVVVRDAAEVRLVVGAGPHGALEVVAHGPTGAVVHATARTAPIDETPKVDPTDAELRCGPPEPPPDGIGLDRQSAYLRFGPRWSCVRRRRMGEGEVVAELDVRTARPGAPLDPAVLDVALGSGLALLDDSPGLYVPTTVERFVVARHAGEAATLLVHAVLVGRSGGTATATFDVAVVDESGVVVVHAAGLTFRRLEDPAGILLARPPAREAPGTALARALHEEGLRPAEGLAALDRVLASDRLTTVAVSPVPLDAVVAALAPAPAPETGAGRDAAPSGRPPRDEVEHAVGDLWADLLGVAEVGLDDDFFALGGHSLVAVRLFARLRARFGVRLGLASLYEAPTVEALANLVRGRPLAGGSGAPTGDPWRPLVAMRPGGTGAPLFLVHGKYGNVLVFRDLVEHLDLDLPVYGIQAIGLDGVTPPLATIEAMADRYVEEIRTVQATGPYHLAGYSAGGVICLEIAQRLRAAGEDVPLVGLLDTYCPTMFDDLKLKRVAGLAKRALRDPRVAVAAVRSRLPGAHAAPNPPRDAPTYELVREEFETTVESRIVGDAYLRAQATHRLRPYPGTATLFRASRRNQAGTLDLPADLGWKPWIADLDVVEVGGDHLSLLKEPNVDVLAAALVARLR